MSYTFSINDSTVAFPEGALSALLSDFVDNVKALQTLARKQSTQTVEALAIPLTTTLIVNTQPDEGWQVVSVTFASCFELEEIILSQGYEDGTEARFVRYTDEGFIQRVFTLQEDLDSYGTHNNCSPYEEDRLEVIRRELRELS